MTGIFDWLTQPKPGNVTQTTGTELGPEAKAMFAQLFPQIQAANKPITPFAGPTVAGFDSNQTAGLGQVAGAATGSAQGLADAGTAAQKYFLDPARLDVTHDPNITRQADAITGGVTRNLQENILPGVRTGGIQAGGMYSGGASKAGLSEGKAIGDTNLNLESVLSKLFGDAYQGAAGRAQHAVDTNGNAIQTAAMPGVMQYGAGQASQDQAQKELDAQISQYYTPYALQQNQISQMMQLLGLMPGAKTTSNSTGTAPQGPLLTQLLGAAANVGSKIAMA